jgi:type IV secretory pathway TrbL component
MLPTRRGRRPGLLAVLLLLLLLATSLAPSHAAGDVVGDEERVGEAAAAVARGEGVAAALGAAEAGGEVALQGNATNKEGSLADMIDRALEKEFPDSEGEQGGGGAWI